MRVLHVINSLGGSGGAEHGLVREITRFEPDVEQLVVRLFGRSHLAGTLVEAGIPTVSLDLEARRAARNWTTAARRLVTEIRRFRPDVVHTSLFTANLAGQLAARRTRTPVLSTLTQSGDVALIRSYQPGAASWRAAALRAVATRVGRGPRIRYRALTEHTAVTNAAALGVPTARIRVIPRGVDTSRTYRPPAAPPPRPLVVNVGRQTAQKGHEHLVDAFERVAIRFPEAELWILGRKGERSEVLAARIAASVAGERIRLLGYRPDALDLVAAADVFAFPSLMEGLGTAVLEAMAAGVPVVAFDIPPVREITDDGRVAVLVPVGDGDALAEAILHLLADDVERTRLVRAARDHVTSTFAIDGIARRVQAYLEEVAAS